MSHSLRPALLLLACLAAGAACAAPAPARATTADKGALDTAQDPFAPVYVVMSRKTWNSGLQSILRNPLSRRDSVGTDLVLARISQHQLTDLSEFVHEKERRCGGDFAFDTQAKAEAFLRADRSREALLMQALPSYTIDNSATVNPWLPQVTESNIRGTISSLSTNWPNRYYASSYGPAAATWIHDTWLNLAAGRSDVTVEYFTGCTTCSNQSSVILTIAGHENADEVVVLGGHMDSISSTGSGNSMNAPGADDDASGISSLTEVLRIALASGWKPKRTVKFMAYAAEEPGLRGSAAIAANYKALGVNVVGAFQLDMTDYRTGSPYDMQLITDYSNPALQQFLRDLFDTYLAPLGMTRGTYTCGYGCSDHASWTANGYPAAFMYEGGDFPYLHTPNDNLGVLGNTAQPSVAHTKLGLAYLGELAKTSSTTGGTTPADFSFTTNALTANFTDASTHRNGSILPRSGNLRQGTRPTATNPSHTYSTGGSYDVTLTVTDNSALSANRMRTVTVSNNVLSNGVAVTNISAVAGAELLYTLSVPVNSTDLKFAMQGGTGNADLYVKFGSAPTDTVYDCRPYRAGNLESCSFATPQAGTWYVRIKARTNFSGTKLTPTFVYGSGGGGGGGAQTYTVNGPIALPDLATTDIPLSVSGRTGNAPASTPVYVNITHPRRGDLRIRLIAPDGSSYTVKASSASDSAPNVIATFNLNLSTEALNGTWKLRVVDTAGGNAGTLNSWSITF